MIGVSLQQKIGSAAMAYCFARRLAMRWGYAFRSPGLPGFPLSRVDLKGRRLLGPRLRVEGQWPRDGQSGRNLVAAELQEAPGAWVTLSGEFQRFEFISDVRDEVRGEWLRDAGYGMRDAGVAFDLRPSIFDAEAKALMICVREGDEVMGEADVRRLAGMATAGTLHFLTDREADPLRETLRDLGGAWHVERGLDALRLARSFARVAFCQSALYWWAAFLGDAREIYFPKIDKGPWSHPEPPKFAYEPGHYGIDLRVPDEARYLYDW